MRSSYTGRHQLLVPTFPELLFTKIYIVLLSLLIPQRLCRYIRTYSNHHSSMYKSSSSRSQEHNYSQRQKEQYQKWVFIVDTHVGWILNDGLERKVNGSSPRLADSDLLGQRRLSTHFSFQKPSIEAICSKGASLFLRRKYTEKNPSHVTVTFFCIDS